MAIAGVRALASSLDNGSTWTSFIHKTGGPATLGANGRWADMSMGAGIPKYNAYVGSQLEATVLTGAGNDGIYCGPSVSGTKHINRWGLQSLSSNGVPSLWNLCDYLMFYPLVDGDSTDQQDTGNTATLTRYTDGLGVQCMAVCTTPMSANATCTVSYTNAAGVSGRTTSFSIIASTAVGCIVSSSNTSAAAGSVSPFIPLADGDTGMRSIESVTMVTPSGGFFALVLVKPLCSLVLRELNTFTESTLFKERGTLPEVKSGAYLNLIYNTGSSGQAYTLRGFVEYAWS